TRQAIVLAALAGAMQMLAGAPEVIILTWAFIGAMWLAQLIWTKIPKKQMLTRMPVIVALVAGLAAAQLLPFFQFLQYSQRNSGFGGTEWAMPLSGPANFLVPLFHCFQASHGVFVQYGQYWVSSHYLGAGLMVLATAGAIFVKKRRIWLLLALALFCIWMAMGAHAFLYPIIRKTVPLLGLMRYPIKFVVLPIFIIPLLAAYGVRWVQAQAACGNAGRARNVLVNIALVALFLIGVIVLVEWKHPLGSDNWTATWHNAIGRAAFVALVPGVLILSERAPQFKIQVLLRCSLLALLWTDVYTHAPALNPTVQRSIYQPRAMRAALKLPPEPQAGEPRFMEANAVMAQVHLLSLPNPIDEYICHRLALYDDCNLLDHVPKTDGFFSLALREPLRALGLVYQSDDRHVDLKGMKDFLGIAHVSPTNADAAKSLDWTNRETAMPLITGGQQPIFASDAQTDAGLMSAKFDPRKTVYLPLDARNQVKAAGADVKIISPQIKPEKISFETEAGAPAIVTLAQAYYLPWHAYVDGHRIPLWRANAGFQALEVPPGKHAIQVIYEDRMFQAGVVISCASLLVLGVVWFSGGRKAQ
ncbi:MAG TPA: hypothetical protein VFB72_13540, partial [Verrucomicrobiae bacterium]|nr:hypothetical protein [Verrucomicrobiae bacterium]